jgi:hypothetical protein
VVSFGENSVRIHRRSCKGAIDIESLALAGMTNGSAKVQRKLAEWAEKNSVPWWDKKT